MPGTTGLFAIPRTALCGTPSKPLPACAAHEPSVTIQHESFAWVKMAAELVPLFRDEGESSP